MPGLIENVVEDYLRSIAAGDALPGPVAELVDLLHTLRVELDEVPGLIAEARQQAIVAVLGGDVPANLDTVRELLTELQQYEGKTTGLLGSVTTLSQQLTQVLATLNTPATGVLAQLAATQNMASQASGTAAAAVSTSRLRTARVPVPAIAANLTTPLAVTWPSAFPSTSYTVAGVLVVGTALLKVGEVGALTPAGCTVQLVNVSLTTALAAGKATLHVSAIHDPLA